jgi:hypothetical protein
MVLWLVASRTPDFFFFAPGRRRARSPTTSQTKALLGFSITAHNSHKQTLTTIYSIIGALPDMLPPLFHLARAPLVPNG